MIRYVLTVLILFLASPAFAQPAPPTPVPIDQQIAALTRRIERLETAIAALQADRERRLAEAQPTFKSPGSTLHTEITQYGTIMQTYSDSSVDIGTAASGQRRQPLRRILHLLFHRR